MYYVSGADLNGDSLQDLQRDLHSEAPLTMRSRSVVFQNAVFSVYADHIVGIEGIEVERYLSVVPKCLLKDGTAGVAVLPTLKEQVGLIKVYRHPQATWSWEAVKGHIERHESPRVAAARELAEETGYERDTGMFRHIGYLAPEAGVIKARTQLFVVDVSSAIRLARENELGHSTFAFFSIEEALAMIESQLIEDATTIALLMRHIYATTKPYPGTNSPAESNC